MFRRGWGTLISRQQVFFRRIHSRSLMANANIGIGRKEALWKWLWLGDAGRLNSQQCQWQNKVLYCTAWSKMTKKMPDNGQHFTLCHSGHPQNVSSWSNRSSVLQTLCEPEFRVQEACRSMTPSRMLRANSYVGQKNASGWYPRVFWLESLLVFCARRVGGWSLAFAELEFDHVEAEPPLGYVDLHKVGDPQAEQPPLAPFELQAQNLQVEEPQQVPLEPNARICWGRTRAKNLLYSIKRCPSTKHLLTRHTPSQLSWVTSSPTWWTIASSRASSETGWMSLCNLWPCSMLMTFGYVAAHLKPKNLWPYFRD